MQGFTAWGRANPFALSLLTATGKTAAADAMTQRCIEGRPAIDARRLALFTAFGFGYLGIAQYWLYTIQFARWFPAAARFGEHATLSARLAAARTTTVAAGRASPRTSSPLVPR